MRVVGGLIVASLFLAGCRSKQPADRPKNGPRAAEGKPAADAGPAHAPARGVGIRIVVDAERILVDGRPIGARSELSSDVRVLSLFRVALDRHIRWQDGPAGEPFEASSDSTVPADLTWPEGANLAVTLASANHPGPQTVHSGDKSFTFDFYDRPLGEEETDKRFLELCRSSEGWSARTLEDRDAPMHQLRVLSPWRPVTADMLGKLVAEQCAGSCSSFSIGAENPAYLWRDVLEMMDSVRRAKPDRPLPVTFTSCPVPAKEPPVRVRKGGELRAGEVSVRGALPHEVVARIVRQNFGRFRLCYDDALDRDPKLAGRVVARVTIDHTGGVSKVVDAGSKLEDAVLLKCVLGAFRGLTFPQPDHGKVTVIYPLTFEPKP